MRFECWRARHALSLRGISAIELVTVMAVSALTYVTLLSHQQRELEQESLEVVAQHMQRIADSAIEFRKLHNEIAWPNAINQLSDNGVSNVNIASRYGGTFDIRNASWQQGGGVEIVGKFTASSNLSATGLTTFYRSGDVLHSVMKRIHGDARVRYSRFPAGEGDGYQVILLLTDEEFSRSPSTAFGSSINLDNGGATRRGYLSTGPVNISNVLVIGNIEIAAQHSNTTGNYQQCGFCRVFNQANEADQNEGGDLINTTVDYQGQKFAVWLDNLTHRQNLAPPLNNANHEILANRIVSTGLRFKDPHNAYIFDVTLALNQTNQLRLGPDAVLSAPVAYLSEPWGITGGTNTVNASNYSRILNTRNHVRVVAANSIVFNNTTLWNTLGVDCANMVVNWMFYYSDERMKNVTGILDGERAIETVRRTPMYRYDWRQSQSKGIGLLAQDVANIDGVGVLAKRGVHGVSPSGMIATVWSAVDELAQVTADLQKKSDLLQSEIQRLRERKHTLQQISTAELGVER